MIILSGGGDGAGLLISHGRITKIPPHNPELIKAIAAANIFQAAQKIKDVRQRKQAEGLAQSIAAGVMER